MFGKKKFSDEAIIVEIRKGNQEALVFLYEDNYTTVRNYILKNNGNPDDVEDVLQEAVIVVWQNVQKTDFTLSARFSTYIYSIVRNLWLKNINKNKRMDALDEVHTSTIASEIKNGEKIDMKLVRSYVDKLNDTCRTLLQLFYFDGLDMTKIAEKMQFANADTAKSKKYQCFKKLEEMIKSDFKINDFLN